MKRVNILPGSGVGGGKQFPARSSCSSRLKNKIGLMKRDVSNWVLALSLLATGPVYAEMITFESAQLLTGLGNRDTVWSAALDAHGDMLASFIRLDAANAASWASPLILKINTQTGDVIWSNEVLRSRNSAVAVATDGSIFVAGSLAYINDDGGASLGGPQDYFSRQGIDTTGKGAAYLARLSPTDGTTQSVLHFGSSLYVMPRHLQVAPDGDLLVSGIYMRAAAQFGETTLPAPATSTTMNLFVVRMSPVGEIRWTKAFVNSQRIGFTTGLAVDASGNVVFGGWSPADYLMDDRAFRSDNGFALKLSAQGELVWAKEGIGYNTRGNTFHVDREGCIYFLETPDGLQKNSPEGDLLWSRPAIGSNFAETRGSYVAAGSFRIGIDPNDFNRIYIGERTFDGVTVRTEAELEMYVVKYSASGDLQWVVQSHGQDPAYRPWPDGTFSGAGYIASWTSSDFVFVHPERGILVLGKVMGKTLFGETFLEGHYRKDFQPETSFFIASIAEPGSDNHALRISRSGGRLTLSWPAAGTSFNLETTEAIAEGRWEIVPQQSAVVGDQNVVELEPQAGTRFYRLRKP
jgi:hypothetical protein